MVVTKSHSKGDIFAFWFAMSFILNGYATGVSGVSLGSAVFMIMVVIALFSVLKNDKKISTQFWGVLFGFLCCSLLSFLFVDVSVSGSAIVIAFTKLLMWICIPTIAIKKFGEYEQIRRWMMIFANVLTIYIILQTICFYTIHLYLPNIFNIGILKPYVAEYADYSRLSNTSILRPGSLLSESSFYGNFVLCTIVMCFDALKDGEKKLLKEILFLSVGVVVSTSTSAIVLLLVVWLVYLKKIPNKLKPFMYALIAIVLGYLTIVAIGSTSNSGFAQAIQYSLTKFQYASTSSRLGKSFDYLDEMKGIERIIGVGLGNSLSYIQNRTGNNHVYLNSVTSLLVEVGWVGITIFFSSMFALFRKIYTYRDKVLLLIFGVYIVKGFASGVYFSTYGILFMSILFSRLYYLNKKGKCV